MQTSLLVNRIQRFCIHDGPGIRNTVFLQGCPLKCWWCHNPETREPASEDAEEFSPAALLAELERDRAYFDRSGGGITVSGGEPLLQAEALNEFLQDACSRSFHTALDTSGEGSPGHIRDLAPFVSLWLWDVKAVSEDTGKQGIGYSPEQGLSNLSWILGNTDADVWIRIPLIASFNSTPKELRKIADWIGSQNRIPPVQILPGHTCAGMKAGAQARTRIEPSSEEIVTAVRILKRVQPSAAVSPEEPEP